MITLMLLLRTLLLLLPVTSALKFDLQAHTGHSSKYERCIRNFVAKDTLVLVTAIVGGSKGDGQMVNMHVSTYLLSRASRGQTTEQSLIILGALDQRCCRQ